MPTANHVTTLINLKSYIDENLLSLALATTVRLNAAMDNPTTKATANAVTSSPMAIGNMIRALEAELKRMKAGHGVSKGGKDEMRIPRVKCTQCNDYHTKVPTKQCWTLPGNQASNLDDWKPHGEQTMQD